MNASRRLLKLACIAMLLLTSGCGRDSGRLLAPTDPAGEDEASAASAGRMQLGKGANAAVVPVGRVQAESSAASVDCPAPTYQGPIITVTGPALNYTYPTGGVCVCEAATVPYQLPANRSVTLTWSADGSGGCTEIQAYRWALDIADVFDETPRIDEATDLSHWSQWSLGANSATVGPFSPEPGSHLFLVEARDRNGFVSLGLIQINVTAAVNLPPDCSGAVADLLANGPPNGSFERVVITGVTDPNGDPITIAVTGVSQDEPLVGIGERRTCPDAMIEGGGALVRRERSGAGNGRVYTIAFRADDGQGGVCQGTADVCIPLYPEVRGGCVKGDLSVNSLSKCTP